MAFFFPPQETIFFVEGSGHAMASVRLTAVKMSWFLVFFQGDEPVVFFFKQSHRFRLLARPVRKH